MHTTKQKTPTHFIRLYRTKTPALRSFYIYVFPLFLSLSLSFCFCFYPSLIIISAMVRLSSLSSCSAFGSCLTILCLLFVQPHIASSALIISLRNHHKNHQHRRPMIQTNQSSCALFAGTWVRDDTYPVYQSSNCPIIDPQFNCQMYGRPDSDYLKYRWEPLNCQLPR